MYSRKVSARIAERCRLIVLILISAIWQPTLAVGGSLEPDRAAGDVRGFSLLDLDGQRHSLEGYRGKVLLVNFWASWCPPCIYEMPGLQRLADRMAGKPFEILAINVSEPRYKVRKFVKLVDLRLKVLLDDRGQTFKGWQATVLPTSYVLDKQGEIRYRVLGDLDWDGDEAISVIEGLVSEPRGGRLTGIHAQDEDARR